MKRILTYSGYTLGGLVALVLVAYAVMSLLVYWNTTERYDPTVNVPEVKRTSEAIKRGRHVARIRGCRDCHADNFSGETFISDPMMGQYAGSNLTSGEGGVGQKYDPVDWARAIRHGVGPDGRPLLFMPSYEYDTIGNEDLGALIAFLESLPPVDHRPSAIDIGPMSKFLYVTGGLPQLISAEIISHETTRTQSPEPAVTVEYGEYVATSCTGCHGQSMSGGPIPGVPPSWPKAPNLTRHPTGLDDWSYTQFETLMRTGETPSGRTVNTQYMPWKNFRHMTDVELKAIWTYLQSLEPREQGNR